MKIDGIASMELFQNLIPERKKEFIEYLKSIGAAIGLGSTEEKKCGCV